MANQPEKKEEKAQIDTSQLKFNIDNNKLTANYNNKEVGFIEFTSKGLFYFFIILNY